MVAVVLGLFLVPAESIRVVNDCIQVHGADCPVSVIPISASASVTYAYFGIGAVQVPGLHGGHAYCLMYGSPETMCGAPWQRMMG